jgi:CHAD domain-containing protein
MADGKWIPNLRPTTPVADAARHALTLRLEVVRHYLPLAVHEYDKDVEHVHQLRVGTRRAGAALAIFSCCLPRAVTKRARKLLRRLRRAAGQARDWDVFLDSLEALSRQPVRRSHRPAVDFLSGYALAQREIAQVSLQQEGPDSPFAFERLLAETLSAVEAPPPEQGLNTLIELARPLLEGLFHDLHQAASGNLDDYDHLHRVRILGKRLRYAMEVFADCFAPAFREGLYPQIEQMQEILGEANDGHVASQRLRAVCANVRKLLPAKWARYKHGLEGLLRQQQRRLEDKRAEFLQWWKWWQTAGAGAALGNFLKTSV